MLKQSVVNHAIFFCSSLCDGLLWRQHQVIQQLSRGNPLDCTLPPDNEWKCPLASSKLTSLLGGGWFPTCLHFLGSECSFLYLFHYSRSGTSRFSASAANFKWLLPAGPVCSSHLVALLIRWWICYETDPHGFCVLHTEWVQVIQYSPGVLCMKCFLYSTALVLAFRS